MFGIKYKQIQNQTAEPCHQKDDKIYRYLLFLRLKVNVSQIMILPLTNVNSLQNTQNIFFSSKQSRKIVDEIQMKVSPKII